MTTQHWNPDNYARNARFVSDLGAGVFELLAPRPGEQHPRPRLRRRRADRKAVAAGCRVIAVDSSAEQIGAARARGLDARAARAEDAAVRGRVRRRLQQRRAALDADAGAVIAARAPRAEARRPLRRRVRRRRLRATIRLALIAALERRGLERRGAQSVVLSRPTTSTRAARSARLRGPDDGAVPAADAAARRRHRLARDLRQPFLGAVPSEERRAFIAGGARRGAAGAVRSATGLDGGLRAPALRRGKKIGQADQ